MTEKIPCVYILASKKNGTLYTGVTSNLSKRIFEHKNDAVMVLQKNIKFTLLFIMSQEGVCMELLREKNKLKTIQEKRNWN